jgi:hypothetical protein
MEICMLIRTIGTSFVYFERTIAVLGAMKPVLLALTRPTQRLGLV